MHIFVAVIGAMLGMANATSSMILKWKMQFACAVVWWTRPWRVFRLPIARYIIVFLIAIFLCQIVFGIYAMIRESRRRHRNGIRERSMPELPELNPVIHGKLRLALLSLLVSVEEAEFTWLRARDGLHRRQPRRATV